MPISAAWNDEAQTIIYCKPEDDWTWDDFFNTGNHISAMIASVDYPVYIIMDLTNAIMPAGNAIVHFRSAVLQKPENTAAVIYIITDGFKRTIISVLKEMIHGKRSEMLHVADSIEEAHELITILKNA